MWAVFNAVNQPIVVPMHRMDFSFFLERTNHSRFILLSFAIQLNCSSHRNWFVARWWMLCVSVWPWFRVRLYHQPSTCLIVTQTMILYMALISLSQCESAKCKITYAWPITSSSVFHKVGLCWGSSASTNPVDWLLGPWHLFLSCSNWG